MREWLKIIFLALALLGIIGLALWDLIVNFVLYPLALLKVIYG